MKQKRELPTFHLGHLELNDVLNVVEKVTYVSREEILNPNLKRTAVAARHMLVFFMLQYRKGVDIAKEIDMPQPTLSHVKNVVADRYCFDDDFAKQINTCYHLLVSEQTRIMAEMYNEAKTVGDYRAILEPFNDSAKISLPTTRLAV